MRSRLDAAAAAQNHRPPTPTAPHFPPPRSPPTPALVSNGRPSLPPFCRTVATHTVIPPDRRHGIRSGRGAFVTFPVSQLPLRTPHGITHAYAYVLCFL